MNLQYSNKLPRPMTVYSEAKKTAKKIQHPHRHVVPYRTRLSIPANEYRKVVNPTTGQTTTSIVHPFPATASIRKKHPAAHPRIRSLSKPITKTSCRQPHDPHTYRVAPQLHEGWWRPCGESNLWLLDGAEVIFSNLPDCTCAVRTTQPAPCTQPVKSSDVGKKTGQKVGGVGSGSVTACTRRSRMRAHVRLDAWASYRTPSNLSRNQEFSSILVVSSSDIQHVGVASPHHLSLFCSSAKLALLMNTCSPRTHA
jgi:hypothetical protein